MKTSFLTAGLICSLMTLAGGEDLRFYTIGNSLTDGLGIRVAPRDMLQLYIASSGTDTLTELDACNTAGAALYWLWNYIDHSELNSDGPWDVLTIQPYNNGGTMYDDKYPGTHSFDQGDVFNAKNFISQALTNSPNIQPYIYSHWPSIPNYMRHMQWTNEINPDTGTYYTWEEAEVPREEALAAFEAAGGWSSHWDALYTDLYSSDNDRTRDYFEQLVDILNTDRHTPGDPIENLQHDVLMIPVGDVMYELNRRMKADPTQFPRAASAGGGYYTNIVQIHSDIPHLDPGVGRFIGGATWYATIYHRHPGTLDYTVYNDPNPASGQYYTDFEDPYYEEITATCAAAICDAVWDVVSTHPYAGVASADADSDALPDWWERNHFGGPTNATADAIASNGVNTVAECYIAGISPVHSQAKFRISTLLPQASSRTLQWSNAFGRTYKVYWTSNLLDGFGAPLESNLTDGIYNDTNHPFGTAGYYKIGAQLQSHESSSPAPAQNTVLASWNFDNQSTTSTSEAADVLNSELGVTSASVNDPSDTLWVNIGRTDAICWRNLDDSTSASAALSGPAYIEFTIAASNTIQITNVTLRISTWADGTSTTMAYFFRSSTDGYASDVSSVFLIGDNTTNPGATDVAISGANGTNITLRMYGYVSSSTGTPGDYGPFLGIGSSTDGVNDIEISGTQSN